MKFDFIVGNPPYYDEAIGDNKTFAPLRRYNNCWVKLQNR